MELPHGSAGKTAPILGPARISQVFVADDSEFVRGVIRKAVETQLNLKVCGEAGDGPEAIDKAKTLLPDVVILDLAMPTMNGLEVATTLRKHLPEAIIILVTVYENALGRAVGSTAAMKTGINAALSKHEGINKIVATIQELITRSQAPDLPEPSAPPAAAFDLFRIESDGQIRWLEAVPDLHTAKARLQILGVSAPGRYLVFSQATENKLPYEVNSQGVLTSIPQIRS
jgi:CheY-like chemotaxis protein